MSWVELPGSVIYDLRSRRIYYPPGEEPSEIELGKSSQTNYRREMAEGGARVPLEVVVGHKTGEEPAGRRWETREELDDEQQEQSDLGPVQKVLERVGGRKPDEGGPGRSRNRNRATRGGSSSEESSDDYGGRDKSDDEPRSEWERIGPGKAQEFRYMAGAPSVKFPEFDGKSSARAWAEKAERVIIAYRIPDDVALTLIEDAVQGTAAQIFDGMPRSLKKGTAREVIQYIMGKCKQQRPVWAAPVALFGMIQARKESVLDFSLRIQKEARALGLARVEHLMLSVLVKGVAPSIAVDLIRANPRTWVQAVETAQNIEALQGVAATIRGTDNLERAAGNYGEKDTTRQMTEALQKMSQMIKGSLEGLRNEIRGGRTWDSKERPGPPGDHTCWSCGKMGHFMRECPQKRARARAPDSKGVRCWRCGEMGHYQSECGMQSNQDRMMNRLNGQAAGKSTRP